MKRLLRPRLIFSLLTLGLLATALAVSLLFGSPNRSHAASPNGGTESPEGSWFAIFSVKNGPPPFKVLIAFDQGGSMVESEQGDEAPGSPPTLFSPGYGAWSSTDSNAFAFNFVKLLYDTNGGFIGLLKNHGTAQLAGKTLTGSGSLVIIEHGTVIFSSTYTLQATRIQAEGS
jgi:hypothetical protein